MNDVVLQQWDGIEYEIEPFHVFNVSLFDVTVVGFLSIQGVYKYPRAFTNTLGCL